MSAPSATAADAARLFLTLADEQRVQLPQNVTPEWIDQNTSFVYLGRDVDQKKLSEKSRGTTIIVHTKLEAPLKHPEHGDMILAAYPDGHAELHVLKDAPAMIAESIKTLDAARDLPAK